MLFRKAVPTLIGVAALLAAGGALAQSAQSEGKVVLASYYSMGDRAVDPMGEAIRAVLIERRGPGRFHREEEPRRARRVLPCPGLRAVVDH